MSSLSTTAQSSRFHPRTVYALTLAQALTSSSPLSTASGGVFLSGLRRCGKSTFVKNDLMPALQHAGTVPVYVDLWSEKRVSPFDLVGAAVRATVKDLEGPASKLWSLLKRVRPSLEVDVGNFTLGLELEDLGKHHGPTLSEVFVEMVRKTRGDIVLIVDEVQQAALTEDGQGMLHALKAARDAVNLAPGMPGRLIVLGVGSEPGLVRSLTMGHDQPFMGADNQAFQPMGRDFARWVLDEAALTVPGAPLPSEAAAAEAFAELGHRPRELIAAVRAFQFEPTSRRLVGESRRDVAFLSAAKAQAARNADAQQQAVYEMGDVAVGVFERIARGTRAGLFGAAAMAQYARVAGRVVDESQVQQAAQQLLAAGIIQRSGSGNYEVTEPSVRDAWIANEQAVAGLRPASRDADLSRDILSAFERQADQPEPPCLDDGEDVGAEEQLSDRPRC